MSINNSSQKRKLASKNDTQKKSETRKKQSGTPKSETGISRAASNSVPGLENRARQERQIQTDLDPESATRIFDTPIPGRRDTPFEEFRVWMHSAKGWIYALVLVAMIYPAIYSLGKLRDPGIEKALEGYFAREFTEAKVGTGGYMIGDLHRSKDHILNTVKAIRLLTYGSNAAQLPIDKYHFQRFAVRQYQNDLLARAALRMDLLQRPEIRRFVVNETRNSLARAYVLYSIRNDLPNRLYRQSEDGDKDKDKAKANRKSHADGLSLNSSSKRWSNKERRKMKGNSNNRKHQVFQEQTLSTTELERIKRIQRQIVEHRKKLIRKERLHQSSE
ncbi:MAG: hypothetical protein RH862_05170 [Leptospiraceae bacterium]